MIPTYRKRANIAVGIWVVSLVSIPLMFRLDVSDAVFMPLLTGQLVAIGISLLVTFWYIAKAKGYCGLLGVILYLLPILGLILLVARPDRHKEEGHGFSFAEVTVVVVTGVALYFLFSLDMQERSESTPVNLAYHSAIAVARFKLREGNPQMTALPWKNR